MDAARAALRTMGCAAQIELEKVAWPEWRPPVRRGYERCDVRRFGRGTRARRDDEGRREVHRYGRIHQASSGNNRKATAAVDSQSYGAFLTAPFLSELPCANVYVSARGDLGRRDAHDRIRTRGRIGNYAFPQCSGRWERAIGKVMPRSGKTANKFVVVVSISKSKERTQW